MADLEVRHHLVEDGRAFHARQCRIAGPARRQILTECIEAAATNWSWRQPLPGNAVSICRDYRILVPVAATEPVEISILCHKNDPCTGRCESDLAADILQFGPHQVRHPTGMRDLAEDQWKPVAAEHLLRVEPDLQDLVEMGALTRTGERRHTRYWLHLQKADAGDQRSEGRSNG